MYRVTYLPLALRDAREIAEYLARDLCNPAAADSFAESFARETGTLASMPYRRRVYAPIKPLEHDMRALPIGSYLAFYWVEEEPEQRVVVARVIYAKRDLITRKGLA